MGNSKLFIWEGSALFAGKLVDISTHHHNAVQYCVGLEDFFEIKCGGKSIQTKFAVINANIPHKMDCQNSPIVTALVDNAIANQSHIEDVSAIGTHSINCAFPPIPSSIPEARNYVDWLVNHDNPSACIKSKMDQRIESIIPELNRTENSAPTAKKLATKTGLSESRFMHLFKLSTGIPMRRYILWRRIINTISAISDGESLTAAAHYGGFSDSAHFSRIFRETFGLAPSQLFQNSRFIQVIAE